MASNLINYSKDILQANKLDLDEASRGGSFNSFIAKSYLEWLFSGLKSSLLARLGLSEKKLKTLSNGLEQIAEKADVLGSFHFLAEWS